MPYEVKKNGPSDKPFCVYLKENGERLGCAPSDDEAQSMIGAIEANKHSGKSAEWLTEPEVRALCPACADKMISLSIKRVRVDVIAEQLGSATKADDIAKSAKYLAGKYGGDPSFWRKCSDSDELASYDAEARAAICARAHHEANGTQPGKHRENKSAEIEALAAKGGARNSGDDLDRLQQIHDLSVANGASCGGESDMGKAMRYRGGKNVNLTELLRGVEKAWFASQGGSGVVSGGNGAPWVQTVYDDSIIVQDSEGKLFRVPYTLSGEGDYIFADRANWQGVEVAYTPVNQVPLVVPEESKRYNFSYIKSLHPTESEEYFRDVIAVKKIGKDDIRHYVALWGTPEITDLTNEFFTGKPQAVKGLALPGITDFWDSKIGLPRPLTWDHNQDANFKGSPVIGVTVEYGDDEVGRWANSVLDANHGYRKFIDDFISKRDAGASVIAPSSDSAGQYVVKEKSGKGIWIKQWPWFATALTPTPCEPRMLDIGSPTWKSIAMGYPELARMGALDGAMESLLHEGEYLSLIAKLEY